MYENKRLELLQVGAGAVDDLSATGIHSYKYQVLSHCDVGRFMAVVTTLMNGAATVVLKRRPTPGSASGESVLATLVIPDTTVVGKVLFKDFKRVSVDTGDELIFEVTIAASVAGGALYGVEVSDDPEDPKNNADMVASA